MRPRRPRTRPELPPEAAAWLRGGDGRPSWIYFTAPDDLEAFWREHGEAIVAEHVARHPGTRPRRWWEFDAPEPRQRLGGIGSLKSDRLADVPRYALGLPVDWIADTIDPNDPPTFESQATYLRRHGLLLPGEERRLQRADFAPEVVEAE